jgi:hypothetical protein
MRGELRLRLARAVADELLVFLVEAFFVGTVFVVVLFAVVLFAVVLFAVVFLWTGVAFEEDAVDG